MPCGQPGCGADPCAIAKELDAVRSGAHILVIEHGQAIADVARGAVKQAMARGGAVVAAGGDGTINAVAQAAHDAGCLMGVLPQGTFNYFGRTHGIPAETTEATRALLNSCAEPVQVGLVNDHVFLVNASLGLYPPMLEDREEFKPASAATSRRADRRPRDDPAPQQSTAPSHRARRRGPRRADTHAVRRQQPLAARAGRHSEAPALDRGARGGSDAETVGTWKMLRRCCGARSARWATPRASRPSVSTDDRRPLDAVRSPPDEGGHRRRSEVDARAARVSRLAPRRYS